METVRVLETVQRGLGPAIAIFAVCLVSTAEAVIISEIHYNPPAGDDALEFIEIVNESSTPEDISGYGFVEGIAFVFPAGTILGAGEYLVVCADADAVRGAYGIDNALGDYGGRLDGSGERLTLANQVGVPIASLRYRDEGKWSTAPDGSGHSLVLRDLLLDPGEPESWTSSPELGGSPGERNFPEGEEAGEVEVIAAGASWSFARGTAPYSNPVLGWTLPDFDDGDWTTGPAGFGYGDGDDETVLDDMRNGYSTIACRATFFLGAGEVATTAVHLAIRYDDGFCAFVNGQEVASAACPEDPRHDSLATEGNEARDEERFAVPASALVAGENVVAILGLNVTVDSTDFSLAPRVLARRAPSAPGAGSTLVINELHRGAEPWVELYNPGSTPFPLAGATLSRFPADRNAYEFPESAAVPPGGFHVVDGSDIGLDATPLEVRVFLTGSDGRVIAAAAFDRSAPPGLEDQAFSEVAWPDGGEERRVTLTETRAAPNEVPRPPPIVINEIFYHPPEDREAEFLELLNTGERRVDLSGFRFTRGMTYTFPDGTGIEPGGYVVVSNRPEDIERDHGIEGVLGPYEGVLSNRGENIRLVDTWGNIVDEVRYWEGGDWSLWADGRGSSLELIDPRQPNDHGMAWAASDESDKSSWERLSYSVTDHRTTSESELHLMLAERGVCLVDDVSIRRGGGANHIPNAGFESSTTPWRIEGNHIESRRVTWDARSGNASLELAASGKGDTSVNRIETDTSPRLSSGAYEVSLWARWLRGASLIIAHGEFVSGPWGGRPGPSVNISGNTLGGRMRLTVPRNLGTPGAENSQRRRLIDESGSGNLGPVIAGVAHFPAVPDQDTAVTVSARILDADGVASARVLFREGDARGAFTSRSMTGSGGFFQAELPARPDRRKVVFYVEATDGAGAMRRYPESAPDRTLVYQVLRPSTASIDPVAVVLDDERTRELGSRRLHSNHLLDGTYVFAEKEVHYNIGLRYRGSPWGRPQRASFRVRFERDRPTHVRLGAVNLSSRANGPVEAASHFLIGRAGTGSKPASAPLYRFVSSRFNGSSLGTQRLFQPVDGRYIDRWFPGSDGPVLKAVARLAFNDSGQRTIYDGASFDYMGRHQENYRFYYNHVLNRSRDDWQDLTELMRVMDPRATSNAEHDRLVDGILDVEGFLRVMVPRMFVSDWDTLGMGQGHNAYLVFDSTDGLWETIPFDLNQAMPLGQVNFPVFPSFDRGWARLISRPAARRTYVRIANEFLDGYWSTQTARPFLDAMERDVGISMGEVRQFIASRSNVIRREVVSFETVPFRILTGGGTEIETSSSSIVLLGDAPSSIAVMIYDRNGEVSTLEPAWQTPTRWSATVELPASRNEFRFFGFSSTGELLEAIDLVVLNTSITGPRFVRGDANGDGMVNLSDAVTVLFQLFSGLDISCADASDVDDNGSLAVSDAIRILEFLFRGGRQPERPFPIEGEDPTADELDCVRSED